MLSNKYNPWQAINIAIIRKVQIILEDALYSQVEIILRIMVDCFWTEKVEKTLFLTQIRSENHVK